MNKSFFVVFLGIILGAMVLIFLTQPTNVAVEPVASSQTPGETAQDGPPTSLAAASDMPQTPPPAVAPSDAKEPVRPDLASGGEPARSEEGPGSEKSVSAGPVAPKSEDITPVNPEPVMPKPEADKPDIPAPTAPQPEAAAPAPAKPQTAVAPAKPAPTKPQTAPTRPQTAVAPAKPTPVKPQTAPQTAVAPAPPVSAPSASGENTRKALALNDIKLSFKGKGMALRIEGSVPFSYKTFALSAPDRYVVDLVGEWKDMRAPTVPSNNIIKGARVGRQPGGSRLVLDMQRAPKKHSVTWVSPTVLEIVIE